MPTKVRSKPRVQRSAKKSKKQPAKAVLKTPPTPRFQVLKLEVNGKRTYDLTMDDISKILSEQSPKGYRLVSIIPCAADRSERTFFGGWYDEIAIFEKMSR